MPPHGRVLCPNCRHKLLVRPEQRGREGRCRYCGHTFQVQSGDEPGTPYPREWTTGADPGGRRVMMTSPVDGPREARVEGRADASHHAASYRPVMMTTGEPAQAPGRLDQARERTRHEPELRRELEQARSELDRLRSEVERLRGQAAESTGPGESLEAERARRGVHPGEESPRSPSDPAGPPPLTGPVGVPSVPGPGVAIESAGGDDRVHPAVEVPDEGMDRPVDFEIPGYRILGKICDGSMGTVFKARQVSVDRIVAVKVLRDVLSRDEEYTRRFWCEASIAANLSHPNIVTTLDAGEVDGHPYIVMEYVEGETIQVHLDRGRIFGERAALEIILAVAEALGHDLRRGLVHRDIKPANVILTPDGGIKLTDLGLARPTGDEGWALAEAGLAVGTPEYISPEQVRGQVDVDIRSDLYSLGATLYHMVTGRVPYGGGTTPEAMRRHVDPRTPLIPPDAINPELTKGLGAVVGKMMARNREERYRSPEELILDLKCMLRAGRPLLAEQAPEALAALAVGDAAGDRRGVGVGAASATDGIPPPPRAGDDGSWGLLVLLPALLLALTLLATVALLVVP
jgi:hypothetical protein